MKNIKLTLTKDYARETTNKVIEVIEEDMGFSVSELNMVDRGINTIQPLDLTFSNSILGGQYHADIFDETFKDVKNILMMMKKINLIHYFDSFTLIELSKLNINPYILGDILEIIGYEQDEDALEDFTNGWEHDFSIPYHLVANDDSDLPHNVSICGCMMTFELKLTL